MSIVLFILTALSFLAGFVIMGAAASSIHEILATCMFIVSAITLSGACIVAAVDRLRRAVERGPVQSQPGK